MSYVQKVLLPDEQVLKTGMLHWVVFLPGLLLTVGAGVFAPLADHVFGIMFGAHAAAGMHKLSSAAALAALVFGLVLLIGAYIRQNTTELAITDRRIIAKYGFIARSTFEIMLNRVTGANFDQSVGGRILGYGTIIVHGAGGDISPFDGVADPQGFHRAIIGALEKAPLAGAGR